MQFLDEKLVWLRKTSGKTQQQMADACGVCRRTWVSYEQGSSDIPTMRLVAVSVYCYIDIATLLADVVPNTRHFKQLDLN